MNNSALKFVFVSFLTGLALLWACNMPQQSLIVGTTGEGVATLKILADANSPYNKIARTAVLLISAPDMNTMTISLTITDTSVEGTVHNISAGEKRLFEVYVYDSAEIMQYKGSATADIIADSTAYVSICLYRVGGSAVINGKIIDSITPASTLSDGLVAYFPFNGNANDESKNGFNATVNGATLSTDRFGNNNKAYYFNGGAGMVAKVNSLLSVSKFTIAAWFKYDGTVNYAGVPRIAAVSRPGECNGYYELLYAAGEWNGSIDNSKKLICFLDNPASTYSYYLYYSNKSTDAETWHHGAITYDNGDLKFYIDGVFDKVENKLAPVTQFSGSAVLQIGYCEGGGYFYGKLDDIRIYNRALKDAEIQAIYSMTK